MILIDRDDVVAVGLSDHIAFLVRWDPNDPVSWAAATEADWADIPADGPFLLVVNDEYAWAGQNDGLYMVAGKRHDPVNLQRWKYLADLYAHEMTISRQSLVLRFTAMRRQAYRTPGKWIRWSRAYHWPEGSDLAWSALLENRHPSLKVREHEGKREVRVTG